tara:strand:+ start:600 stop:1304 length:705 start_codon:yes stop_codon:yes gene_type:complete
VKGSTISDADTEESSRAQWFNVSSPQSIKAIDRNWVQITRIALLLVAVLVTWWALVLQEEGYDRAATTASGTVQTVPVDTSQVRGLPDVKLPTLRPFVTENSIDSSGIVDNLDDETNNDEDEVVVESRTSQYVVRVGDNLINVAAKFGVSLNQLMSANGIVNADSIFSGQVLVIPEVRDNITDESSTLDSYTVLEGDTLQTIANKHAVSLDQIQAINNIANPDSIFVGQVLSIP